jgi:Protein of unknown function (DUF1552)
MSSRAPAVSAARVLSRRNCRPGAARSGAPPGPNRSDRATGVLADHADQLTIVRGVNYPFPNNGCGHALGLLQCLTAARPSGTSNTATATGVSADTLIWRRWRLPATRRVWRLLNTLITANGVRRDGGPVDNFGDPSLAGGLIDAMLA